MRVALSCFAQDGYDGTSLRAIAAGAGVDVAIVARLYGSKFELWKAVIDHLADQMAHAQTEAASFSPDGRPVHLRLAIALRHFVRFHTGIPELPRFFSDEVSRPGERRDYIVLRLWQPHREMFLPLLVEATEAGMMPGVDPETLLVMMVGAIGISLALPVMSGRSATPLSLEQTLLALCLGRDIPSSRNVGKRDDAKETARRIADPALGSGLLARS
ncbi:TetR/AcrR family transcriptional regulator [Paenirhodobacter populi]